MKKLKSCLPIFAALYITAIFFGAWGYKIGRDKFFPSAIITPWIRKAETLLGRASDGKNMIQQIMYHRQEFPKKLETSNFEVSDESFVDPGYLLASYYKKEPNQTVIDLIRIHDFKILHRWNLPLDEILKHGDSKGEYNSRDGYRAEHPLLLENGSVVFTSGEGPLVRLDVQGKIEWINDKHFHHAIERDHEGNIYVPSINDVKIESIPVDFRDDSYAVVSPEGKVIDEHSISQILLDNGYNGLLMGTGTFRKDRIHLNDAQPILRDQGKAKIGDVLLSIRNLSTVLLYRPQTNKVIWLKTGPWLNQHDINPLDNATYSIFGNDVILTERAMLATNSISEIYVYDPASDTTKTPYTEILKKLKMRSNTQGRSRILPNGDVYIEETPTCRLIRTSKDKVRWTFVNCVTDNTIGALHWVRYYTPEEIDLSWFKE